jgi:hypothetical protein
MATTLLGQHQSAHDGIHDDVLANVAPVVTRGSYCL